MADRYASQRFFRALRLLTRHHNVPLIMDEVQTGFGLGGGGSAKEPTEADLAEIQKLFGRG